MSAIEPRLNGHANGHAAEMDAASQRKRQRRGADLTAAIAAELRRRIGANKHEMWFSEATLQAGAQRLEVRTASSFVAQRIEANFGSVLRELARAVLGEGAQVDVCVIAEPVPAADQPARNGDASKQALNGHSSGLNGAMTSAANSRHLRGPRLHALEDFVIGPTNQLAHSTCMRLAEDPEALRFSPLFVHGECGVGKTHLLQGVCRRYIERTGRAPQVRYVTAEQFTNEYISAVKAGNTDTFRARLRRLDLLAIDDVHFLADKGKTQSEFQHTLDAIALSGARVVLASDHHPHHIQRFSQALVSRFMSGMVVKIERPDRTLRRQLIERMAGRRGLRLSAPAVDELAGRCTGSVRELEGAITRLAAYRDLLGQATNGQGLPVADPSNGEIGLLLVEQVLREERARPAHIVRIASIIDTVCGRLGLTKADLIGGSRHRKIVLGRSMVVYLARELTTQSYPEIAQALGRENHSTVHTADQRLRRQLGEDQSLQPGMADPARTLRELADILRREACRAE